MFALIAVILFAIGIFVLGTVHTWAFWLLLGLVALALDFVLDLGVPGIRSRSRV